MERRCFRGFVLFFLVWFSPVCIGQIVKIRVIDDTNGHPLQKQQISISLLYEKGERVPANYDALLHVETDVNGEVQFRLPEPAPAHIAAQVHLTSEHWHCGCTALVATPDLTQKGVVVAEPGHGSTRSASAKAEPGEILFVARPFTFLERLLYPLVKG